MSERDLDALCSILLQMPPEAMLSLNETGIWWLPELRGASPMQAVNSIRLALEALSTYDTRVFCVAWLYCCLAGRQAFRAWRAYRVGSTDAALTGDFILHERLASALKYPGCHVMGAKVESPDRIHACVMATHPERSSLEHNIISLCVLRSMPRLFVCVVRDEAHVINVLQSLLRGNAPQLAGSYLGELSFAFSSTPEHIGDIVVRSRCTASDELEIHMKTPDNSDVEVERCQPSRESYFSFSM
ncbi:hypothetical protein MRX96_017274 [Rhipicephalus microplus]